MDMNITLRLLKMVADARSEEAAALKKQNQEAEAEEPVKCSKCGRAIGVWEDAELVNGDMVLSYVCSCGNSGEYRFSVDYEKTEVYIK